MTDIPSVAFAQLPSERWITEDENHPFCTHPRRLVLGGKVWGGPQKRLHCNCVVMLVDRRMNCHDSSPGGPHHGHDDDAYHDQGLH